MKWDTFWVISNKVIWLRNEQLICVGFTFFFQKHFHQICIVTPYGVLCKAKYVQYDEHDEVRIGNYFICSSSSFWRANNLFKASHSTVFSCQIQLELTCYFALQKIRNERFQLRVLYLPWENWDQVTRDPLIILPLEFADMPPDQQKSFLTFLLFWVLRTVSQQPQNFGSGTLHLRTFHLRKLVLWKLELWKF